MPRRPPSFERLLTTPIGVLYEHPLWFEPLFAELDRRGLDYERIEAHRHAFDPADRARRHALVVNRMSPSAWTRGHAGAIFHTVDYLAHLEATGTPVLNGRRAYEHELSKARQLSLLAGLDIRHPRTIVIADPADAPAAAGEIGYPVLVKPNVGGSGAGIRSFASRAELERAALEPSLDGTLLVQEHVPAAGEAIVRVEVLDGELLYAIRLLLSPGSFNLCPADYCELPGIADGVSGRGLPITRFDPPDDVVDAVVRIAAAAGLDLGGVEYLVDARTGEPVFYDVNALSNFVANAREVIGFDPFVDLADLIEARAAQAAVPVGT
jgi:glutathione synthase/RimK-type ligase-like ATP-grasp enzyme